MHIVLRIVIYILVGLLLLLAGLWFLLFTDADRKLILSKKRLITVDGTERVYRLIDLGEKKNNKPLVIGLHGFGDRGIWMGLYSGLHKLSEEKDILVAFPEGLNHSWNANFCCGSAFENNTNDTEFILKMIEEIQTNHDVDKRNIYAVGFSNGGAMAQKLLAERPDIFKGVASVMSGVGSGTGSGKLNIDNAEGRIVLFQGEKDPFTPVRKGNEATREFNFLSAEKTKSTWVKQLGADLKDRNETDYYEEEIYIKNNQEKVLYRLYLDTTHRWPMWRPWTFPNQIPDSTLDIWNFLNKEEV